MIIKENCLEQLATNRQMMQWCSLGCGEWNYYECYGVGNQWSYDIGSENKSVSPSLRVRSFDSEQWIKPTESYILDCIKRRK